MLTTPSVHEITSARWTFVGLDGPASGRKGRADIGIETARMLAGMGSSARWRGHWPMAVHGPLTLRETLLSAPSSHDAVAERCGR